MNNLLIISPSLGEGGTERVSSIVANYFQDKGYKVIFVAYLSDKIVYQLNEKIKYIYMGKLSDNKYISRVKKLKKLRQICKTYKIDYLLDFTVDGIFASFALNLRKITSLRNDPRSDKRRVIDKILRFIGYVLADCIVFQTNEMMSYFPKFIQKKGVIIHNPISPNLPKWDPCFCEKVIIAAGRLTEQKNFKMLINAAELLVKDYPDYCFNIFGHGEQHDILNAYIEEKHLSNRVKVKDFTDKLHEQMKKSSIYVSTSWFEGISNSMIEAMGIGLPSICTDCSGGGARETIISGVNGILVPVNDAQALYQTLKNVIESPELACKLSDEATKINDELSAGKVCFLWEQVLNINNSNV